METELTYKMLESPEKGTSTKLDDSPGSAHTPKSIRLNRIKDRINRIDQEGLGGSEGPSKRLK